MSDKKKNVKIVVLGDIGHSPRMANHALELSRKGHTVDIVGYGESNPANSLKLSPNIYYHYLTPPPKIPIKLLNYLLKTMWTSINLLFLLLITRKADMVFVQNPPAIPSLYISWFYCKIIRAQLVIDWHNYAHTIMALSVGNKSPLVYLTKKIEFFIGKRADFNICVSKSMQNDLNSNWGIRSKVLYDCPSENFSPIQIEEKHNFLLKLSKQNGFEVFKDENDELSTIFTKFSTDGIFLKEDRPGFLVTSTSWTEDEDFSILVDALQEFEDHWQNGNENKCANLIVAITGKGPLKNFYCNDILSRKWQHIQVITPWLDIDDYPEFIGCADLGISLHTSSSGLDLPMKIVDLFACCVPVLAYNFKALNELVKVGKNGFIFENHQKLSELLLEWFDTFPKNKRITDRNENFRKELMNYRDISWEKTWKTVASPIF